MTQTRELETNQGKHQDTGKTKSNPALNYLDYLGSKYSIKSINEVIDSKFFAWTPVDLEIKDRYLVNPEIFVARYVGTEHVFFRCQDKRFPPEQYIGGFIVTIDGEKLSPDEVLKRLVSKEEVRIKLAGSKEEIVLENRSLLEIGSEYHSGLGFEYSRWEIVTQRPGVNIDRVSQDSLAAKIGLRARDVILGAVYVDSSGRVCKEIFETKRELTEFLGRAKVLSSDHRRIQFIIKRPEQTREEVLKSVEEGSKAALTRPIMYDRFNRRFKIDD